jgi:hypothetical protein
LSAFGGLFFAPFFFLRLHGKRFFYWCGFATLIFCAPFFCLLLCSNFCFCGLVCSVYFLALIPAFLLCFLGFFFSFLVVVFGVVLSPPKSPEKQTGQAFPLPCSCSFLYLHCTFIASLFWV